MVSCLLFVGYVQFHVSCKDACVHVELHMFNGMMFVGGAAYCEGLCSIT